MEESCSSSARGILAKERRASLQKFRSGNPRVPATRFSENSRELKPEPPTARSHSENGFEGLKSLLRPSDRSSDNGFAENAINRRGFGFLLAISSSLSSSSPLSRGLVSESSCVHACTLARACVLNVHAFAFHTPHAHKYVYAYALRTTDAGGVRLHSAALFLLSPAPRLVHYNRFAYEYTGHLDGWYAY